MLSFVGGAVAVVSLGLVFIVSYGGIMIVGKPRGTYYITDKRICKTNFFRNEEMTYDEIETVKVEEGLMEKILFAKSITITNKRFPDMAIESRRDENTGKVRIHSGRFSFYAFDDAAEIKELIDGNIIRARN